MPEVAAGERCPALYRLVGTAEVYEQLGVLVEELRGVEQHHVPNVRVLDV